MRLPLLVLTAALLSACVCCPPGRTRLARRSAEAAAPRVPAADPGLELADTDGPAYIVETSFRTGVRGRRRLLSSPRLVVRPGQSANMSMGNEHTYVADFDPVFEGGVASAEPTIGTIRHGLRLDMLVRPVEGDAGSAWIAYHMTQADPRTPMRRRRVRLGRRARPVLVEFPQVARSDRTGVQRVRHGANVLLTTFPSGKGGDPVELYVTLRALGDVGGAVMSSPSAKPDVGASTAGAEPESGEAKTGELASVGLGFSDRTAPAPDLGGLIDAAAGAPGPDARLAVTFVRLRRRSADLEPVTGAAARDLARGARRIERIVFRSALAPGSKASTLVRRAYLQDYDVFADGRIVGALSPEDGPVKPPASGRPLVYDPVIGTIASGRGLQVIELEGVPTLELFWATMPPMSRFSTRLETGGPTVSIELPELRVVQKRIPLRPGRWLVPLAHGLAGGFAVWVDYAPSAGAD